MKIDSQIPCEPEPAKDAEEALQRFVKETRRAERTASATAKAARIALDAYNEICYVQSSLADLHDLVGAAAQFRRIATSASNSLSFSYSEQDAARDSDDPAYSTIISACAAFAATCKVCAAACSSYEQAAALLNAQNEINGCAKAFAKAFGDFDASSDAIITLAHARSPEKGWVRGAFDAGVKEVADKVRKSRDSTTAFHSAARSAYEAACTSCDIAIDAVRAAIRDVSAQRGGSHPLIETGDADCGRIIIPGTTEPDPSDRSPSNWS